MGREKGGKPSCRGKELWREPEGQETKKVVKHQDFTAKKE